MHTHHGYGRDYKDLTVTHEHATANRPALTHDHDKLFHAIYWDSFEAEPVVVFS